MNVQKISMTTPHHKSTLNFKNNVQPQTTQPEQTNDFELPSAQEALAQSGVMIVSSTKTIAHPDDGTTEKQKYTALIKDGKVQEAETTIQYFTQNGENYGTVVEKEDLEDDMSYDDEE